MIEAVLFDMDGILIDSEIRQMTDYVVSDLGKVISCISNF